jgi:hypothetical protein
MNPLSDSLSLVERRSAVPMSKDKKDPWPVNGGENKFLSLGMPVAVENFI